MFGDVLKVPRHPRLHQQQHTLSLPPCLVSRANAGKHATYTGPLHSRPSPSCRCCASNVISPLPSPRRLRRASLLPLRFRCILHSSCPPFVMATPSTGTVTVKESPLPPPTGDPLSPEQWVTLLAFADAVVPSIAPSVTATPATQLAVDANDYATALAQVQQLAGPDVEPNLSAEYLAETPSACPGFRENIHRLMAQYIPADTRKQLLMVLNVLKSVQGAQMSSHPTNWIPVRDRAHF